MPTPENENNCQELFSGLADDKKLSGDKSENDKNKADYKSAETAL